MAGKHEVGMAEVPLLELRNVKKRFAAIQVLRGVTMSIRAGEVTALVGDNGAGKSTLIKCVAGVYQFDEGMIIWEGREVHIPNPKVAAATGIEFVYQDLALCNNLDVVQNMFLGRERHRGLFLDDEFDGGSRPGNPRRPCGDDNQILYARRSPACPADSASRWPSPRPSCGTPSSWSSTSRPPHWALRRRSSRLTNRF